MSSRLSLPEPLTSHGHLYPPLLHLVPFHPRLQINLLRLGEGHRTYQEHLLPLSRLQRTDLQMMKMTAMMNMTHSATLPLAMVYLRLAAEVTM